MPELKIDRELVRKSNLDYYITPVRNSNTHS